MAKESRLKIRTSAFGLKKETKRDVDAAKEIEGKKIADQLKHNKSTRKTTKMLLKCHAFVIKVEI